MTVKEVAEYLHLDEHTIYRMAREGKIPAFKVANQWRFKNNMIEEWLQKQINTIRRNGKRDGI
jgi:DNA binding domain, excisionase family